MPKKRIKLKGLMIACFKFRGIDLLKAREKAGLSEQELAERLEFWTQQNISRLESSDGLHTITFKQMRQINKALNLQAGRR